MSKQDHPAFGKKTGSPLEHDKLNEIRGIVSHFSLLTSDQQVEAIRKVLYRD